MVYQYQAHGVCVGVPHTCSVRVSTRGSRAAVQLSFGSDAVRFSVDCGDNERVMLAVGRALRALGDYPVREFVELVENIIAFGELDRF